MKPAIIGALVFALFFAFFAPTAAAPFNAFGMKQYTVETEHFKLHYFQGLRQTTDEIAVILEHLHDIYQNKYGITLPAKTEVIVSNSDESNGWALAQQNIICIWAAGFDFNLRGDRNWLENVVSHEYAHIVSISAGCKSPPWIPYVQAGWFSHPNEKNRIEAFHFYPNEVLPIWFVEGIAQYESTRQNGDSWDSHRDMLLRTLSLSDNINSFDRMGVFSGRNDDYEKSYNHGFSLVTYIAETYGEDKIPALLRESGKIGRLNFDRSIKAVLGISGRQLYKDWNSHLKKKYVAQITTVGTQVFGRDISADFGTAPAADLRWNRTYTNFWPRFSPDGNLVYSISNNFDPKTGLLQSGRSFYSFNLCDTLKPDKRVKKIATEVKGFYSLSRDGRHIAFTSTKSRKSELPANKGGERTLDIFIDSLPPDTGTAHNRLFQKHVKTERQITKRQSAMKAVLSPDGTMLAFAEHDFDHYFLTICDTAGKNMRRIYPLSDSTRFSQIFSLDWSPKGDEIAICYLDRDNRKIGIVDTAGSNFRVICDTRNDERDPRFSPDGKALYFSSDRSGIANIYRYDRAKSLLERLTNVSGGAFCPDVSPDGKKLVFAGYAPAGYRIYLLDSIKVLESIALSSDSASTPRTVSIRRPKANSTEPERYSGIPRKALIIPTFFGEQTLADKNDFTRGVTAFKTGLVFALVDPLFWEGRGSYLGGYFLVDAPHLFNFVRFNEGFFNRKSSYDLGLFLQTNRLPIDISISYAQRGIAGTDNFKNTSYGGDTVKVETLDYNLSPQGASLSLTHWLVDNQNNPRVPGIGLHAVAGIERYSVWVKTSSSPKYFSYAPSRNNYLGASFTSVLQKYSDGNSTDITSIGSAAKLSWQYNIQELQNEVNSFDFENGRISENYLAAYRYHSATLALRKGLTLPFGPAHTLQVGLDAAGNLLTQKSSDALQKDVDAGYIPNNTIPSYMKVTTRLPGYVYYFKDTLTTVLHTKGGDTKSSYWGDTLLIAGNELLRADISWRMRFLKDMDRSFGFLYFESIYGVLNAGGAAAVDRLADISKLHRDDPLYYIGAELRVSTQAFGAPLAISARIDRGLSRPAPLGGNRFSLSLGTSFDSWDIVVTPTGDRQQGLLPRARMFY